MSVRPVARGVMVCERVIVEEGTRNVSAINCFARRLAQRFPTSPSTIDVFAPLIGGQGDVRIKVRVSRGDTLEPILTRSISLAFVSPLQEVRFIYRLMDCIFPVEGSYQLELLADDELIALTTFEVRRRGSQI